MKSEEGEEKKFSKFNKKKHHGRNNNATKRAEQDVPELLKGVKFSMAKNGPDLYLKALEKLQLYASTTYKNGADVLECLKQEKITTFTPLELNENAMPTEKEMCEIHANNTIKCEELLEANLEAMYDVGMSICDPVLKDQICNHEDYEEINNKQDILGLLKIIKKVCTQMEMTPIWDITTCLPSLTTIYNKKDISWYKITGINLLHIEKYVSNWVLKSMHQKVEVATC